MANGLFAGASGINFSVCVDSKKLNKLWGSSTGEYVNVS